MFLNRKSQKLFFRVNYIDNFSEVPNDMMETAAGWLSAFNKTVSAYLPYQFMQVSELMTTERSFATAKLPCVTESNRVALVS